MNNNNTILIVDDEPANIDVLVNILKNDYIVQAATNAQKAMEIINSENPPQLILLDVMMPGTDGYETCRLIKADPKTEHIPIIFVTAKSDVSDETYGFEIGASDYLTKPVTPSVVLARVSTHLALYKYQKELENLVAEKTDQLQQKVHDLEIATQAKSNFLACMSHEIRTPMNAILGFIQILQKSEANPKRKEYFNIIQNSGNTLLGIINDILNFSKIENGKIDITPAETVLQDVVDEVCQFYREQAVSKSIQFLCELSPSIPSCLMLDATHLKLALFNLLDNALKFTLDGGDVSLHLSFDEENRRLGCSVSDTGVGIAKESLEKIFNLFEQEDNSSTRKFGGIGLGLAIASNLITLMGGKIQVESEVGKGSRFFFDIPVTDCHEPHAPGASDEDNDTQETFACHALIVEDNKTNQMFMRIILDEIGVTYDIANDGCEAVDMFRVNRYDVVLMDENMPKMNGMEATKQIRDIELEMQKQHTPVIAVTANSLSGDRERFLAAGMDEYVSKPYSADDIKKVLHKLLKYR